MYPTPASPPGGSGSHTFAETGKTVDGRFWEVWQGGRSYDDSLYINGLPLTDKHDETSLTDGKIYKVQWFERARFEEHPENQAPYDVLLGLLGAIAAQGRQEPAFQPVANPNNGLQWFPQTKHTLGDLSDGGRAIAAFWTRLGGLKQFGFPLSQPFQETNRDNGKSYLVQYFERQRFEYHPENKGTRYEVLLGRLGAEQMGGVKPPPASPPPPPVGLTPRLVLAFFFPWFGPNVWNQSQMSDFPIQPYSSDQPDVMDRQIREAQNAGIDGFISTWTGQDQEVARNLPTLLQVAAKDNFKISVYFEIDNIKQHGDVEAQLKSVIDTYSDHPAFLHWNGQPVFFFWRPDAYGDEHAWGQLRMRLDPQHKQIWSVDSGSGASLDVFDGLHVFSSGKWNANTDVASVDASFRRTIDDYNKAHIAHRLWAAGVIPGWDESRDPGHPDKKVIPRQDGAVYEAGWCAAIASNPEWITITSYNEWFEGSQIEPSEKYGNTYLDLTRKWATRYKTGPATCTGP
jgi:hypothetical protein